jgi:hypothetical protein
MANGGNAKGFHLKGNPNDVGFSVSAEPELNLEEQFTNLGAADVTPDKLKIKQPLMSSSILESRTGSVFHPAASVMQNLGSNSELVFRSTSQNIRNPNSAVQRPAITPISSPVFAGFTLNVGSRDGKQRDFDESRARYVGEMETVLNLGEESVADKLKFAEDFYLGEYPDEIESRGVFGTKASVAAGGPYYYPPSPQIQSSPTYQQSSGVVPDRFRAGRESLSVIRNVTVRDSKRPKARSHDHEYKRRFSSSGTLPNLSDHGNTGDAIMGGICFQNHSSHEQGHSPSESFRPVQSHDYPDPSLRSNIGATFGPYLQQVNQGFANRERRVADSTFPPSSTGNSEGEGRNIPGGGYSVPDGHRSMGEDSGGSNPPGRNGGGGGQRYTSEDRDLPTRANSQPNNGEYTINLTFEGHMQRHRVTQHMLVDQLSIEAANLFQINAPDVLLMLFGMNPRTLARQNRLSDPPIVGPGATVLVLCIAGHAMNMRGYGLTTPNQPNLRVRNVDEASSETGLTIGSKVLGNFKLPKFDGNSRYWKTWEKNFVRFFQSINLIL